MTQGIAHTSGRRVIRPFLAIWGLLAVLSPDPTHAQILLADDSRPARISVSWPTRDGKTAQYTGERLYQSSAQKSPLAPNLDAYAGLGGTRLNKGLASPKGAVLLVGLYKQDAKQPLFANIADNASITITLDHVFMNHPASPRHESAMMHLRYMMDDLKACGLSGDARNLFNTVDPKDPIIEKASGGSVRPGCLDGQGADHGRVEASVEADGSLTIKATFPYALLRHTKDPYQRTNPGGFFEPNHFHLEVEVLPAADVSGKPDPTSPPSKEEPAPADPVPSAPKPDK